MEITMNRMDFIAAAILDVQATIRAIDVKIAALLVGVLAPLASVSRVFAHLDHFGKQTPGWLSLTIVALFLLFWFLALVALVRAIGAVDNPAVNIINTSSCKGAFYGGNLYKFNLLDVFIDRDVIKASKDPQSFAAQHPTKEADIEAELIFEQMKLIYIRDIKLNRLKWGLRFSLVWLALGILIFLASHYLVK
jgi:hypothetical protein